jgi:hypothetical protein
MPAYPRDDEQAFLEEQRLKERLFGRTQGVKHDYSPQLLDRQNRELTRREDAVLSPPVANDIRWRAMGAPPTMGELAALDRYGVQPGVVGQPLPQYAVDRTLRQVGPGTPEGEVRSYNRFPDAVSEHQRPPPVPPSLQNLPDWATEQQGTPEFWQQGIYPDDPDRGRDT